MSSAASPVVLLLGSCHQFLWAVRPIFMKQVLTLAETYESAILLQMSEILNFCLLLEVCVEHSFKSKFTVCLQYNTVEVTKSHHSVLYHYCSTAYFPCTVLYCIVLKFYLLAVGCSHPLRVVIPGGLHFQTPHILSKITIKNGLFQEKSQTHQTNSSRTGQSHTSFSIGAFFRPDFDKVRFQRSYYLKHQIKLCINVVKARRLRPIFWVKNILTPNASRNRCSCSSFFDAC